MNTHADLLNELLEVARDGERFYFDAADKVTSPELRGTFRQMAEVHRRLMDDLAEHVAARGAAPSPAHTLAGSSRQAYANALATLAPANDTVYLRQVEAVEDRLLHRYERALEQARADVSGEPVRRVLRRHLMTVRAAHDRMRMLRDQGVPA